MVKKQPMEAGMFALLFVVLGLPLTYFAATSTVGSLLNQKQHASQLPFPSASSSTVVSAPYVAPVIDQQKVPQVPNGCSWQEDKNAFKAIYTRYFGNLYVHMFDLIGVNCHGFYTWYDFDAQPNTPGSGYSGYIDTSIGGGSAITHDVTNTTKSWKWFHFYGTNLYTTYPLCASAYGQYYAGPYYEFQLATSSCD